MKDFNEDITNILLGIRNLYKGCEGIECEDCVLDKTEYGSPEEFLCEYLFNKTVD